MSDPKNPEVGELVIDASEVVPKRLASGLPKTLSLHSGYEGAVEQLLSFSPAFLKRVGLHPEEVARAKEHLANYERAKKLLPAALALVQSLKDTLTAEGHELAGILKETSHQTKDRAARTPSGQELLSAAETLLEYQYGPAQRGQQTRKKLAEARNGREETKEEGKSSSQKSPQAKGPNGAPTDVANKIEDKTSTV